MSGDPDAVFLSWSKPGQYIGQFEQLSRVDIRVGKRLLDYRIGQRSHCLHYVA
jgi:hypothetical protein